MTGPNPVDGGETEYTLADRGGSYSVSEHSGPNYRCRLDAEPTDRRGPFSVVAKRDATEPTG